VRIALFGEGKEEEKNLTQRHRGQEEEKRNGINAEITEQRSQSRGTQGHGAPAAASRSDCATVRGGLEVLLLAESSIDVTLLGGLTS
jgi:hypothetical protein